MESIGSFEAARRGISILTLFWEEQGKVEINEWLNRPEVRRIVGPDSVAAGTLLAAAIALGTLAGLEHGIEDEDEAFGWAIQHIGRLLAEDAD